MPTIQFETKLYKINSWTILHLPQDASAELPSRGMTMVSGTLNNIPLKTVLEPDGRYGQGQKPSHWSALTNNILKSVNTNTKADPPALAMLKALRAGDTVQVSLEVTKQWIEPEVPEDLQKALAGSPKANDLWKDITPMARWDWIRWIRSTNNPETRKLRIEKTFSKFKSGKRSPCCFNRNMCTIIEVCKNGVLNEISQT